MVTFGATAEIVVPDSEIERARQEIEDGLEINPTIDADITQPSTAGAGGGGLGSTMVDLDEERNDLLEDILDELEGGALGGGGGGGGFLGFGGLGSGVAGGLAASGGGVGGLGLLGAGGLGLGLGLLGVRGLQETGVTDSAREKGQQVGDTPAGGILEVLGLSTPATDIGALSLDLAQGDGSLENFREVQQRRANLIQNLLSGQDPSEFDENRQGTRTEQRNGNQNLERNPDSPIREGDQTTPSEDPLIGPESMQFLGDGFLSSIAGGEDPLLGPEQTNLTLDKPDWVPLQVEQPPEPDFIQTLESLQQNTDRAITAPFDERTGLPTTPDAERPAVRPPQAEEPEPPDRNIEVSSEVTVTVEDQRDVEQEVEQEIDDAKREIKRDLKTELRRI